MKVPAAKATAGPIIMSATAPTATPPERVALATSMMWIRLRLKDQEIPHPVNVLKGISFYEPGNPTYSPKNVATTKVAEVEPRRERCVLMTARWKASPEASTALKLGQYTHSRTAPSNENRSELHWRVGWSIWNPRT